MLKVLKNNHSVYVVTGFLSLVLSYLASLRGVLINRDGICYLQSAATLQGSNLHDAMQVCGQARWPFYSILISIFQKITTFNFSTVAFLLDTVFSLISVLTFIYLVSLLKNSKTLLWCAALIILCSHEFNGVREYIIRDHGFWAFYLLSLVFLIRYFNLYQLHDAWAWSLSLVIATLFRIEGALFLLFIPLCMCLLSNITMRQRLINFLKLNSVLLVLCILLFLWMIVFPTHIPYLSRLNEIADAFLHGGANLLTSFHEGSHALGTHVLNSLSLRDANMIFILMLISWYIACVVVNLSIIYSLLLVYALYKKLITLTPTQRLILLSYIGINLFITFCCLLQNMFLSKRYLIALSLILMLGVPFALEALYKNKHKILFSVVIIFILATSLGGIFDFGYSKKYILRGGEWLSTHVPKHAKLFSNDLQLMYHSNHFGLSLFDQARAFSKVNLMKKNQWKRYDFIALRLNGQNEAIDKIILDQQIGLQPIFVSRNKRGDRVVIIKIDKH